MCPAAVLAGRSEIVEMSGIACLDYDEVDDPAYALALASQNPHTVAAFRSLRGDRIKIFSRISTDDLTSKTYKYAWHSAALVFEEFGVPDPNGMQPTSLCALVHDPNIMSIGTLSLWNGVSMRMHYAKTFRQPRQRLRFLCLPIYLLSISRRSVIWSGNLTLGKNTCAVSIWRRA